MSKTITPQGLRKFNLIMAALHAVQGVLVIVLSKTFTLPISGSYLSFNKLTQTLEPASKVLFDLSLPALIAGFLFLSSFFHLVIATIYNKKYTSDLKLGMNKLRWI